MYEALLLGLGLGLASALHCVAMCGPLNAFVAIGPEGATDPWRVVRYHAGRVVGYALLGALLGALGGSLADIIPPASEAILSVMLGVALAMAAVQLWPRSSMGSSASLVSLASRRRGPTLMERASRAVGSVLVRVRRAPVLLGAVSVLLPCGVLASGALLAASTGHAATGAIAMTGLAITSGLAVSIVGASLGRARASESRGLARAMAATLAIGTVVLFARPVMMEPSSPVCCHARP